MVTPNFWGAAESAVWLIALGTRSPLIQTLNFWQLLKKVWPVQVRRPPNQSWSYQAFGRRLNTEPLEKQEGLWPKLSCQPLKAAFVCQEQLLSTYSHFEWLLLISKCWDKIWDLRVPYLLYKLLINVSLCNARLEIRALQESQEEFIHQLQESKKQNDAYKIILWVTFQVKTPLLLAWVGNCYWKTVKKTFIFIAWLSSWLAFINLTQATVIWEEEVRW